jgi:hypothetical protein
LIYFISLFIILYNPYYCYLLWQLLFIIIILFIINIIIPIGSYIYIYIKKYSTNNFCNVDFFMKLRNASVKPSTVLRTQYQLPRNLMIKDSFREFPQATAVANALWMKRNKLCTLWRVSESFCKRKVSAKLRRPFRLKSHASFIEWIQLTF